MSFVFVRLALFGILIATARYAIGAQAIVSLATLIKLLGCCGQYSSFLFLIILNNTVMGSVIDMICHADSLFMENAILAKSPPSLLIAMTRVKQV